MTDNLGRIVATLAQPDETLPPDVVELINRNVNPLTPITAEQVHVRAMYVVSDEINSFGGRFPVDVHESLTQLLIDTPVMVGHRKDKLPIGRTFHAVTVEHDNCRWVKSYFYWLRDTEHAEDLAANIDSGICKECSIAFTFSFPECSVCGKDIRLCDHEPLREYDNGEVCHFNYRHIDRVLETSLVYRGANPNTSITRDLGVNDDHRLTPLRSLDDLRADDAYVIVPRYDSIPVTACLHDNTLRLHHLDGARLKDFAVASAVASSTDNNAIVHGLLVGYRGRLRCTPEQLVAWLSDKPAPVTRVVLNILPGQKWPVPTPWTIDSHLVMREIPHRIATPAQVPHLARQIMTRDGVELYRTDHGSNLLGYHYRPDQPGPDERGTYALFSHADERNVCFRLCDSDACYEIRNCNLDLLKAGRRFVAEKRRDIPPRREPANVCLKGRIAARQAHGSARVFDLAAPLNGTLTCRPIRLNGRDTYAVHFGPHLSEEL